MRPGQKPGRVIASPQSLQQDRRLLPEDGLGELGARDFSGHDDAISFIGVYLQMQFIAAGIHLQMQIYVIACASGTTV